MPESSWCPVRAWAAGTKLDFNLHPPYPQTHTHTHTAHSFFYFILFYFFARFFSVLFFPSSSFSSWNKKSQNKGGSSKWRVGGRKRENNWHCAAQKKSSSKRAQARGCCYFDDDDDDDLSLAGWRRVERHLRTLVIRPQQLHPECIKLALMRIARIASPPRSNWAKAQSAKRVNKIILKARVWCQRKKYIININWTNTVSQSDSLCETDLPQPPYPIVSRTRHKHTQSIPKSSQLPVRVFLFLSSVSTLSINCRCIIGNMWWYPPPYYQ